MIEFRKCHAQHIALIEPSDAQLHDFVTAISNPEALHAMCKQFALSVWTGQRPIAACGVAELWPGRALAWNFMSEEAAQYALPIVRKMRWGLDRLPYRRVEMDCRTDFPEARKWAGLLGFKVAQPCARAFYPDGADAILFERVR
jgi:hypothetical protein